MEPVTPGRGSTAPFGLYLHFPYCPARCPYCAFYFVVGKKSTREPYVGAMEREITLRADDPRFVARSVATIYFGGGTPSLMEPATVARLLDRIRESLDVVPDAEINLECNPDGLTLERLAGYQMVGVNRLTLGWQSFTPACLRALGRTHTGEDNVRSLELAREAGLENVAVDMMFGLPDQTPEGWRREIRKASRLQPDHVSAYELTLEEGTRYFDLRDRGTLRLPDDDARAEMFEETEEILGDAGIFRYEISNYAKPGRECRHNLSGWRSGDLLGIGTSAASHAANARWTNVASLSDYIRRLDAGEDVAEAPEILDEEIWAAEDLYLGLRTVEGIDAGARLERVPEAGRGRLLAVLQRAVRNGLAEREGKRIRLTRRGRLLADSVFEEILVA